MNKIISSKHLAFLVLATRNIGRFRERTVIILVPLVLVMIVASSATFIKDGLLRYTLSSLKDAPDVTIRRISEGNAGFVDQALAKETASYKGVRRVVPMEYMATGSFFDYRNGGYSDLGIYLKEPRYASQVSGLISASHEDVRTFTKDMLADMAKRWYGDRSGIFQLVWLILILTVLLLAWTQAGSITTEIRREIGVLKSLGWQTLDIMELKMMEIVMIGLSGILGGILLGIVYLRMGAPLLKQYFIEGATINPGHPLPVYIDPDSLFLLFVMGLFPLCAATVFAVWLVGTIEPDSAIRSS